MAPVVGLKPLSFLGLSRIPGVRSCLLRPFREPEATTHNLSESMLDPKTVGKNPVFSAEASQVFNNAIMTLGDEDRELP